jgi:diacylglycerol kinase family enzyme
MLNEPTTPLTQARQHELLCVLNGKAASHEAASRKDEVSRLCAVRGKKIRVLLLEDPDTQAAIELAAASHSRVVLAGGGDGTLNAVASLLVGTQTALGILPMGTLNHFSKDLNIPQPLNEAIDTALNGKVASVDVGEVNGQYFLNNSSIGLYPGLVQEREALQRRGLGKWIAFLSALLVSLWHYRKMTVTLDVDGQELTARTPFVFVGNNRYQLRSPRIGARGSLCEGLLWVCAAPRASRLKLLGWMIYSILGGKSLKEPLLLETKALVIRSRASSLHVAKDGEVARMSAPLRYTIKAGALRVMVPPDHHS